MAPCAEEQTERRCGGGAAAAATRGPPPPQRCGDAEPLRCADAARYGARSSGAMAATGVGLRVLQCWAIPILGPWAGTGPSEFLPRQGGPEPSFASTGLRPPLPR